MRLHYPIDTVRLRLEPFQESDGDALYVMESDAEVKQYAGGLLTRQQTEKLLTKFIKSVGETGWGAVSHVTTSYELYEVAHVYCLKADPLR